MDSNDGSGRLIYRDADHSYWLGTRRLLNITTVLKVAGLVDTTWFTDEARVRGSAVHKAILYSIHSDLDRNSLHPIVRPYVEAWEKFVLDSQFEPNKELCEKPSHHPQLFYACTPDAVGWFPFKRPCLIEIKTGDYSTAGYQTAAQNEMPEIKRLFAQRFTLILKDDGTSKLIRNTDSNDWEIFKSALNTAKIIYQKRGDSIWG